ncbi:MAG: FAD-dependent oxidoreductase [Caulobacteraceae bacterium]|nr:FAD-dependent oxidoreductase [Caulobacteraceae bacterium]
MTEVEVLIVGAGPTGLVLALWLTRQGVKVRIVDKAAEPGATSRALAVQARTLEFYRTVGLAEAVIDRGHKVAHVNLWVKGAHAVQISLEEMGHGLSPFGFMFIYPQDEHERLLIEKLAALGVGVERGVELAGFVDDGEVVRAVLQRADGAQEMCQARYLAGCDGARSRVRETLDAGFPGGTYAQLFYVADVEARGEAIDGGLHVDLDEADFLAVFPLKGRGRARLIGTVRGDRAEHAETLRFEDVSARAIDSLKLQIERVNWFSTYHVHHRVARAFRKGRAFLLGDAAHIHSPAGGQGMNTGIGDAVNLAWKLAAVLKGRGAASLLDSYEAERIGFARRLVATTDRAFMAATSPGPVAKRVRTVIAPRLAPRLLALSLVRRFAFRTVSQLVVNYRHGPLSAGAAGDVWGGDRLPWVQFASGGDNFEPLKSLDWQVHVYGAAPPGIQAVCQMRKLSLHVFDWRPDIRKAGLKKDAVYLVRPDGYLGLADPVGDPVRLTAYLDERGLAAV